MNRLGRVNSADRGSGPASASVTRSQNDVYQALDQFAERLFPVTNQESDEIVKQVFRT